MLFISIQCVYYEINILLTYTLISSFQPLLLDSRPMTLCHVMLHMTTVTYIFIIQEKEKRKKKKTNIKSRKIDKKKEKCLSSSIL